MCPDQRVSSLLGFPEQSDRSHRTSWSGVERLGQQQQWGSSPRPTPWRPLLPVAAAPRPRQGAGARWWVWRGQAGPAVGQALCTCLSPVAWRVDKAWWPASHAVFVYSVICSDGAPQAAPQLSVGGGEPLEEGWGQGAGQHHHTPTRSADDPVACISRGLHLPERLAPDSPQE